MSRKGTGWGALLVAQAFGVGCFDIDDLEVVDPSTDAAMFVQPKSDAGADDGGADASSSATETEAGPALCDVAHPCGATEVCAPDGFCMPRCDADGICVAATSANGIAALVADGPMLYYATEPSHDAYGNARDDVAMWSLSAAGELRKLRALRDAPEKQVLLQDASHLYWTASKQVFRMLKDGSADPQALYAINDGWIALVQNDQIVLSKPFATEQSARSSCTIEVGSRDGSAPLRVVNAGHEALGCPSAVADGHAYVSDLTRIHKIDLASGEDTNTGLLGEIHAAIHPYLYTYDLVDQIAGLGTIYRWDLRDLARPSTVVYRAPDEDRPWPQSVKRFVGDRLYQLAIKQVGNITSRRVDLVRSSLVDLESREKLIPATFAVVRDFYVHGMLAVTDSHAFFTARPTVNGTPQDGAVLYAVPLPTR